MESSEAAIDALNESAVEMYGQYLGRVVLLAQRDQQVISLQQQVDRLTALIRERDVELTAIKAQRPDAATHERVVKAFNDKCAEFAEFKIALTPKASS